MNDREILAYLEHHQAVLTNGHFVYTSGKHGTAYVNMRVVGHHTRWLSSIGQALAHRLYSYDFDLIIGPETLGRTLASFTGVCFGRDVVWCTTESPDKEDIASFPVKLPFDKLVAGKRVAIVDDLLTTGSSLRKVVTLVESLGGAVAVAAVAVRRNSAITAQSCNVPHLEVLSNFNDTALYSPTDCAASGPCSRNVPMARRPGHGYKWLSEHPGYPSI